MTSTKRRVALSTISETAITVLEMAIAFIMLPFLLGVFEEYYYGLWVLVGTITGYFYFIGSGFATATQRYLSQAIERNDLNDKLRVINASTFIYSIIGILILAVTVILYAFYHCFYETSDSELLASVFLFYGIRIGLLMPLATLDAILIANLNIATKNSIRAARLISSTILALWLIRSPDDFLLFVFIDIISHVFFTLCKLAIVYKRFPFQISFNFVDKNMLNEIFNYSLKNLAISSTNIVNKSSENILIANYLGIAAIATYTVAHRLVNMAGELITSLSAAVLPLLSQNLQDDKKSERGRYTMLFFEISLALAFIILIGLVSLGEQFILLWIGHSYEEIKILILLISITLITERAQTPLISSLYALNMHKIYAKIYLAETLLKIVFIIVLIKDYGLYGVALGSVIPSVLARLVILPYYTARYVGIPLFSIYSTYLKNALVAVAVLAVFFALDVTSSPLTVFPFIGYTIAVGCIASLCILAFTLSRENKKLLLKAFRLQSN